MELFTEEDFAGRLAGAGWEGAPAARLAADAAALAASAGTSEEFGRAYAAELDRIARLADEAAEEGFLAGELARSGCPWGYRVDGGRAEICVSRDLPGDVAAASGARVVLSCSRRGDVAYGHGYSCMLELCGRARWAAPPSTSLEEALGWCARALDGVRAGEYDDVLAQAGIAPMAGREG